MIVPVQSITREALSWELRNRRETTESTVTNMYFRNEINNNIINERLILSYPDRAVNEGIERLTGNAVTMGAALTYIPIKWNSLTKSNGGVQLGINTNISPELARILKVVSSGKFNLSGRVSGSINAPSLTKYVYLYLRVYRNGSFIDTILLDRERVYSYSVVSGNSYYLSYVLNYSINLELKKNDFLNLFLMFEQEVGGLMWDITCIANSIMTINYKE